MNLTSRPQNCQEPEPYFVTLTDGENTIKVEVPEEMTFDDGTVFKRVILPEPELDAWDLQMIEDYKAGKFDRLIEQAKADHRAGLTEELQDDGSWK